MNLLGNCFLNDLFQVFIARGNLVKTVYNKSAMPAMEVGPPALKKRRILSSGEEESLPDADAESEEKQMTSVERKQKEIENIKKQQELLRAEVKFIFFFSNKGVFPKI